MESKIRTSNLRRLYYHLQWTICNNLAEHELFRETKER